MVWTRRYKGWVGTAMFIALAGLAQAQQPPAPAVTVARPLVHSFTEWDEYTGRMVAQKRVEVRARVSGYLQSVHFREGQEVTADTLLFVIDQRPFTAEVSRASAELKRVSTELSVAQMELERGERLASSKAMSRETLEERRARRDAAQAEVDAARAALRTAELDLGFTEVRAPMPGVVSDIRVDVGNLISGGSADSTLLTTIVSLDPIELEIEGSESEWLRYTRLDAAGTRTSSRQVANPVEARLSDEGDWVHKGQMTFVDNELDADTGTMRGRATFANPDHVLLPGMFARARLFVAERENALFVPEEALTADQATKIVLVVGPDNIVQPREVTLGSMLGEFRNIVSGLTPEDRVIIVGLMRARPGQPVTPEEVVLSPPSQD
ncbi:MAG: efflux RND transporter periplasmic adaptor subunit [Gammaproteobacteria bacterium]